MGQGCGEDWQGGSCIIPVDLRLPVDMCALARHGLRLVHL